MKIDKLKAELEQAKQKANRWQARVRELEKQIIECENLEILQTVRSVATSPEELRGLLDRLLISQNPPEAAGSPNNNTIDSQEDSKHES